MQARFRDPALALAAYQAGPGTVQRAVESGQGLGGLPPHTQAYVRRALTGNRQADATPAPGSNIDALMQGVNAPKPRGVQLAAMLGDGSTMSDVSTPILPDMSGGPVSSAPLPPAGTTLGFSPAPAPTPPVPPDAAVIPQPDAAVVPQPEAAVVPQPEPAVIPQPEPAVVTPPPEPTPPVANSQAGYDQAALAAFNGTPQPTPATVPQPEAAVVPQPEAAVVTPPPEPVPDQPLVAPAGSGETGGQPTVLPPAPVRPQYGPPAPAPAMLAKRLLQPNQGPSPSDNSSDALNAASLAAAQRGENFVPGGAAPAQQGGPLDLFAQGGLQSPYGAPARGGPTGTQLAAPLLPPGAPGASQGQGMTTPVNAADRLDRPDTTGGGPKQLEAPAKDTGPQHPGLPSQDYVDQLGVMAQRAASSSNPRIRAMAGPLAAEAQHAQARIDKFAVLDQQQQLRRDMREESDRTRAATAADRAADRAETAAGRAATAADAAADRKERIRIENERLNLQREQTEQGKLQPGYTWADKDHTSQVPIPGGPADPKTLDTASRRKQIEILAEKGWEPDPDKPGAFRKIEGGPAADKAAAKKPGDGVVKGVLGNIQTLKQIDDSIAAVRANPKAFGVTNYVPGADRYGTPEEQAARARIAGMANVQIHELSGSAVGAKEDERMQQSLPYVTQNDQQILSRLHELRRMAEQRLQLAYNNYSPANGYQAIPGHAGALGLEEPPTATERAGVQPAPSGGQPVRITDDAAGRQAFQSLKPGDQFIGPDGGTYRKH